MLHQNFQLQSSVTRNLVLFRVQLVICMLFEVCKFDFMKTSDSEAMCLKPDAGNLIQTHAYTSRSNVTDVVTRFVTSFDVIL